jgi:hypothetical protein
MQISKRREEARDNLKREKVYRVNNCTPAVIPVDFKVTLPRSFCRQPVRFVLNS